MEKGSHFIMIAKTLAGLEENLSQELHQLGATEIEQGKRMVRFKGDEKLLYKANYHLRTALRILKPIYEFSCNNVEELYAELVLFNWTRYLEIGQTFVIDSVVFSDRFANSLYVSQRVKDALADFFMKYDPDGRRPSVSKKDADIRFNVHIADNRVTLSLDSSGESLHKRGYKNLHTPAPINEVLAAGILMKAGWDGSCNLIDPMCGSGTFLIEAAMMALDIPAGKWRASYSFLNWKDFNANLWEEVKKEGEERKDFAYHIYGSDNSFSAVYIAKENVAFVDLKKYISVEEKDFIDLVPPEGKKLLVTNPPYGERLSNYDLEELYSEIGSQLKHNYSGCSAWIIAPKQSFTKAIALRPSFKEVLFNGDIECELKGFELFEGKRDEFKQKEAKALLGKDFKAKEPKERKGEYRKDREPRKTFVRKERRSSFASHSDDFRKRDFPSRWKKEENFKEEKPSQPRRRKRIGENSSREIIKREKDGQLQQFETFRFFSDKPKRKK